MSPGRILLDVTSARTQASMAGITRTVIRLAQELSELAGDRFACVAFDGAEFRIADLPAPKHGSSGKLLRFATGMAKPAIERLLALPWTLVRPAWEFASERAFRQAATGLPELKVGPGDLFLLFDGGWNYPVWKAARRVRARGALVVPLVHDLMPLQAPQFCVPWVRSAFGEWLRQIHACSDAILCNSASTESELRAYAAQQGWGLPPTGHFRLGSDPAPQVAPHARSALHEFMTAPGPCYATIGSIEPKKNHRVLLDAFEQLWAAGVEARLLVVGRRTPECAQLIARMERLAAAGRPILLLHDASDAEVLFVYRHASAVLLPSLFEGFGLPLVEARTQGCPVFASDIAAFRELADAGVRLFPPESAAGLAELVRAHVGCDSGVRAPPMPAVTWRDSARQCVARVDALLAPSLAPGGATARPLQRDAASVAR